MKKMMIMVIVMVMMISVMAKEIPAVYELSLEKAEPLKKFEEVALLEMKTNMRDTSEISIPGIDEPLYGDMNSKEIFNYLKGMNITVQSKTRNDIARELLRYAQMFNSMNIIINLGFEPESAGFKCGMILEEFSKKYNPYVIIHQEETEKIQMAFGETAAKDLYDATGKILHLMTTSLDFKTGLKFHIRWNSMVSKNILILEPNKLENMFDEITML